MNVKKVKQLPQKERKNQAIIIAAVKIFMEKGFELTCMDEIADHAGVSKRTIYDHFGSKENLFQAILIKHWSQVFNQQESIFLNAQSPPAALTNFAKKFLAFLYQPATIDLLRLLISESPRFPDIAGKLVVESKGPFTRELIAYLDRQKKLGKLKMTDTSRAASYFMGMLKEHHFWPMMIGFTHQKDFIDREKMIKEIVENFLKMYRVIE